MSSDDRSAEQFLSEEEAHRVLVRAVELDAHAASDISLDELRSIASETGITPDALERALAEHRAGVLPDGYRPLQAPRPALSRRLVRLRRHAALIAFLAAAAATPGDFVGLSMLGSLSIYALYELLIRFVRMRERGGPPSPGFNRGNQVVAAPIARRTAFERYTRGLSLRPCDLVTAV